MYTYILFVSQKKFTPVTRVYQVSTIHPSDLKIILYLYERLMPFDVAINISSHRFVTRAVINPTITNERRYALVRHVGNQPRRIHFFFNWYHRHKYQCENLQASVNWLADYSSDQTPAAVVADYRGVSSTLEWPIFVLSVDTSSSIRTSSLNFCEQRER